MNSVHIGRHEYGPLRTHLFICNVHKGVMGEPFVLRLNQLFTKKVYVDQNSNLLQFSICEMRVLCLHPS